MHSSFRLILAALILIVSTPVLSSTANAQSLVIVPIIVNAHVSERVILTYGVEFPGQSGGATPVRTVGDLLIDYEIRAVDRDGNLVAELSDGVPINGFGQINISVAYEGAAEHALLVINGVTQLPIPVIDGRFTARFAVTSRPETGTNPATGESVAILGRRMVSVTTAVVGANQQTKSTYTIREVVPGSMNETFLQ